MRLRTGDAPDVREAHRTNEEVVGVLSPRTERDYQQVVERWTRDGQPDPATWVAERSSEATRRNARAGLIWHFRVNVGTTLDIPWVRPLQRPIPSAFSVEQLALLREEALSVHSRCRAVVDLLYSTGARLQEACAITLEDVTDTHIVLRDTKRRPGGLQVHRAVPLGPVSRAAVIELRQLPPGRRNTLVVACPHRVQDWMRELQRRTGIRTYAHKFRATFATHMLQRGVDIRTVQELMGHTNIQTTMCYLAVSDERLVAAVTLLG
jgi:site-specific recombinase XerD